MASMPSIPRPFADSSVTVPIEGVQSENSDHREISTLLLSPTASAHSPQAPEFSTAASHGVDDLLATDRLRSSSFISHSHHHEALKAANRARSGSATSNSSGSAMALPIPRSGVAGAFGAVTNLVSNVRHAYSPSVSSQTSIAPKTSDGPIQRFLECEADDLKMSEVAILLADYKRLAARLGSNT